MSAVTNIASVTLMVQGTTSDAGKTTLVAGLCRILARRKIPVVPFKPQNMALNSAVTAEGGEIGRAQALQAMAAGIDPHTDMNPVLLKPSSDIGAQVIIHGKALETMDAAAYHDYKLTAKDAVIESYHRIRSQYPCVLVEGAGSPAEINLRQGDIANMGFAEAVDCPVIIVADIDKGGVFAHLVGTLSLLSASEQARVVGFVINRFRGDIGLLQPGLDWLEERTGKPVLGVLPYLHNLYLDAEDAINIDQTIGENARLIKVVIPVFPRISNHTDFDALRINPHVDVIMVRQGQDIPACDLILLPGTKNVRGDLAWLRAHKWDVAIARHLRYGGKLMGICGGYQMLGESVDDYLGIEGESGCSEGLGLLPIRTRLAKDKVLRQRHGTLSLNGGKASVSGYEIHCGQSVLIPGKNEYASLLSLDGETSADRDGVVSPDGQILGTYLHGIFDHPDAQRSILEWVDASVRLPEGLSSVDKDSGVVDLADLREQQINRLADMMEAHMDLSTLDALLGVDKCFAG